MSEMTQMQNLASLVRQYATPSVADMVQSDIQSAAENGEEIVRGKSIVSSYLSLVKLVISYALETHGTEVARRYLPEEVVSELENPNTVAPLATRLVHDFKTKYFSGVGSRDTVENVVGRVETFYSETGFGEYLSEFFRVNSNKEFGRKDRFVDGMKFVQKFSRYFSSRCPIIEFAEMTAEKMTEYLASGAYNTMTATEFANRKSVPSMISA